MITNMDIVLKLIVQKPIPMSSGSKRRIPIPKPYIFKDEKLFYIRKSLLYRRIYRKSYFQFIP